MKHDITLRHAVSQVISELRHFIENNKPYVLFSGGRDSLVALHLTLRASRFFKCSVTAVHVDTTVSTPGNLEYVERVCKNLGVKLIIVRPSEDFFSLVKKWGFPTVTRRWCCYHLKIEPLKKFILSQSNPKIVIDGIRRDESPRRRNFPKVGYHKHFKCLNYHPIFDFSFDLVKRYIKAYKLAENPLYEKFPRATECWCTSFKTVKQFLELRKHFPELFKKFVEAEACLRRGGSALFRNGQKIYLREL